MRAIRIIPTLFLVAVAIAAWQWSVRRRAIANAGTSELSVAERNAGLDRQLPAIHLGLMPIDDAASTLSRISGERIVVLDPDNALPRDVRIDLPAGTLGADLELFTSKLDRSAGYDVANNYTIKISTRWHLPQIVRIYDVRGVTDFSLLDPLNPQATHYPDEAADTLLQIQQFVPLEPPLNLIDGRLVFQETRQRHRQLECFLSVVHRATPEGIDPDIDPVAAPWYARLNAPPAVLRVYDIRDLVVPIRARGDAAYRDAVSGEDAQIAQVRTLLIDTINGVYWNDQVWRSTQVLPGVRGVFAGRLFLDELPAMHEKVVQALRELRARKK